MQVVSSDAVAGTERHVVGLSRELRDLGCDSHLLCLRAAEVLKAYAREQGVPAPSLLSELRIRASIVHVHDGQAALVGPVLAARSRARLVRTQHFVRPASSTRTGIFGEASRLAQRLVNRQYAGYIAVSEAARAAAVARKETHNVARVVVIPPGIRLPDLQEVAAARRRREAGPVVASAGRLERERRFDVLIRAIPRVLESFPSCSFKLIGSGAAEEELRHLAGELGVAQAVGWTGWLPEITSVVAACDLYVNTWPSEGFGMATAEAMACGVPVVVTKTGAAPELINHGAAGVAVDPGDPRQLATAICGLLADRERAAQLGRQGQALASRYSVHLTAQATLTLYREILWGGRGISAAEPDEPRSLNGGAGDERGRGHLPK